MVGSVNGMVAVLSVLTSFLLVLVTYSQFRIQSREFRPDLTIQKVAHHATVAGERETVVSEKEIKGDEILFEVSNIGNGTATQVRAESKLWVIEQRDSVDTGEGNAHGDTGDAETNTEGDCIIDEDGPSSDTGQQNFTDHPLVSLSEFETPRSLSLDVTREDVYHSSWTETMEESIPGNQTNTGYVTRLHVQSEDRSVSLDELLTHDFPEKSALRLRVRLMYTGRIEFRDRFSILVDSVIFPGVCDDLGEVMAAEMLYEQYKRKSHDEAVLDAKTEVERYRQ